MSEAEKIAFLIVDALGAKPGTRAEAEASVATMIQAYATKCASEAAADMRQRAADSEEVREILFEWGGSELQEAVRAAILAIPPDGAAALAGAGWRPIASGPKTPLDEAGRGPHVLVAIPYTTKVDVCDGYWEASAPLGGCWRNSGDDGYHDIQPTHWMPKPAPPPAEGG